MARLKNFYLGALNITIHPHNPEKYIRLFQDLLMLKQKIKIRGDEVARIGSCWEINKNNPKDGLYGDIYKYVELEPNDDWFNVQTVEAATEEELKKISIPENLKPHFNRFAYVFFPDKHRLIFLTNNEKGKTFNVNTVRRFFSNLFESPEILEKYGEVNVSTEQIREQLDSILKTYKINSLSITLTRPNPDDNEDLDEEVLRRLLEDQNVNKAEFNYKAVKGLTVKPNEQTQKYARIANSNGNVLALGQDIEGKPVKISTEEHPLTSSFSFDSDKSELRQLSLTYARQFLDSIIRKNI